LKLRKNKNNTLTTPVNPGGWTQPGGVPDHVRRGTRKPLPLWDRVKFVILFGALWYLTVLVALDENPLLSYNDAVNQALRTQGWLLALAGVEVLRQAHFFISERSPRYHRFWTEKVFGRANRRAKRMSDWTRYRMSRAVKFLFLLAVIDFIVAQVLGLPPAIALVRLPGIIWAGAPFFLQLAFGLLFGVVQIFGIFYFLSRGGTDVYYPDDIKTRFTDVWGQDSVLEKVKENILFLEAPEAVEQRGGYVPAGILLWGPPGTGKTLMAEAVAGETGRPFVFVDPGAFINMFMGVGILKVKGLFRKLRRLAIRYGGVIVFFDEADSLGNRGSLAPGNWGPRPAFSPWGARPDCNGLSYVSEDTARLLLHSSLAAQNDPRPPVRDRILMGGMGGGGMGTLNALLTELSGLKKPRGFFNRIVRRALGMRPKPPPKYRILVMMATNLPQALDEALLRPGRIDRIYKVGYPSKEGRVRTYKGYLEKITHSLTDEEVEKLATITPYTTGAKIKDLVNEALIGAIRDGRESVQWSDVIKAKQLKDLGPPEDVEYIERERHAVAVHEACHALVAYKVRHHLTIDIATIEKGGTYLGMVASIPPEDQFTRWRSEYEADIMVSLASLGGEKIFFDGDSSSGVSGDLESATRIATFMEGFWGMGSTVASHGVTHEVGIGGGGRPGQGPAKKDQELLESGLGERIEKKLQELVERAEQLLAENRSEVLAIAHALESNKTVTGEDVEAIIEGRRGPLIDGRLYRSEEFEQEAEAYHDAVVAAHKGHAAVKVPLPYFSLPAGEPEPAGAAEPDTSADD
jgi:cell division protease FtsH